MCSQSLSFYYEDSPPLFASPLRDWPFNLSPETELARRVKRDHLQQVSAQMISYLLDHYDDRPMDVLAQIEAGVDHSCVRTNSGAVACWGSNAQGQLGQGDRGYARRPVAIEGI